MLNFVEMIDLTSSENNTEPLFVDNLMFSCEADGSVTQFYKHENRTFSKSGTLEALDSGYAAIEWSEPFTPVTTGRVDTIGVKNLTGVGSIAFYNLLDEERSGILSPVFVKNRYFDAPELVSMDIAEGKVHIVVASPSSIDYECYRVVMRIGYVAFEYISYEEEFSVDIPYISGTYECHCVGYTNEGSVVSSHSNSINLYIASEDVGNDPAVTHDVYVSAAALTENGYLKLTLSNGEAVTLNVGLATKQDIQEAIVDTWEASY